MNYLNALESFGVLLTDEDREDKFRTNILNALIVYDSFNIPSGTVVAVCQALGISMADIGVLPRYATNAGFFLRAILFPEIQFTHRRPVEIREFMARMGVLLQQDFFCDDFVLKPCVEGALNKWSLPYVLSDGVIIHKGVKEFDEALVCDVVVWLQDYPSGRKYFVQALQQYYDNENPRDIADNLRKSFEDFLKEFFGNKKNLDKNINVVGTYLKDNGINEEIRCMFTTLISHYKTLNDKTAKHHDDTNKNSIEFLLYQTGVFMRCLIIINENKTEETAEE